MNHAPGHCSSYSANTPLATYTFSRVGIVAGLFPGSSVLTINVSEYDPVVAGECAHVGTAWNCNGAGSTSPMTFDLTGTPVAVPGGGAAWGLAGAAPSGGVTCTGPNAQVCTGGISGYCAGLNWKHTLSGMVNLTVVDQASFNACVTTPDLFVCRQSKCVPSGPGAPGVNQTLCSEICF